MNFPSLNDRDALLESATSRLTNPGAYKVVITPSAENFSVNAAGTPAVAVIDLTATFIGLAGPVTWAAQNGTISNVSGANNTNAQLAFASVTGPFVKVTASVTYAGTTYNTERVIGITKDGAGSYTWTKYSNSSSGASMQDSPTGMSYIGQAFNKPTATPSTVASDYVWTLFKGADANKNHTAFLYQWSTAVPAKPNGSSTFNWASGVNTAYAGTDNWKVAPDANPGTPGAQLFTISAPVTAANSATSTTVSVANYAAGTVSSSGQNGANGVTGLQALEVAVYQWAATIPAGPTGSATLTWASQTFGAAPANWSLMPGAAATPGMTRWKARVLVTDSAAATQTNFNWTSAAILADGYAGTNGTNGTAVWVEISTTAGQVFSRADSAGTFAPTSITLTATQYGPGTATYLWQYWDGSAWVNAGSTAATLAVGSATAFTASRTYRVQMTVGGVNYYDEMTLVKVTGGKDGVNGTSAIVGFLTNESTAVPASNTGVVAAGDLSAITGTFKVFEGVVDKTGAAVTYSVASETGVDVSINSSGVYSVVSFSSDQGAAILQAVYGGVTIQKVFSLAKARAGTSVTGAEGVSYVTAYCASATVSTSTAPAPTAGRNSVPAVNSGGITGTWTKPVPTLASDQRQWQVDGSYNPATDTVIWSIPYVSSAKYGSLSAIVANLGAITAGSIDIGTGAASWHLDAAGNQWAGNASYASAPYRVSNAGAVVASNITIIGGKLDIGSGATSYHVDNLGNQWAGAASYASAPFRVSNTGAVVASNLTLTGAGGATVIDASGLKSGFEAPGTKNSEQQWGDVQGIPYDKILSNDDSVALGFNPSFADWTGTYPAGWSNAAGSAPTKDTAIKRLGSWSVKYVANGANLGTARRVELKNASGVFEPLPAGTFVAGSFDCYLSNITSGLPTVIVRLYYSPTQYRDAFPKPAATPDVWQRVPFSARLNPGERIHSIQFYFFASYNGLGQAAYTGTVNFDGFKFALFDSSVDNTTISIGADGTLGGAGGGKVTITGLGYTGALDATKGAPAGTTVGGTLAETVASNAAAGKSASDALPGINTSLAGKLAAAGNQNLTGPVTLTSSGAIVVGTINDGTRISTTGILGRKGGYTTFSIAADGTALFGGNLVAATGTLGSLRLAEGGYICTGGYTGWNGPPAGTGGGFVLEARGAVWGNYADGRYVAIYENGDIAAPGFSLVNKQLTLDRPVIVNPRVSQPIYDTFAYNALGGGFVSGPNGYLANSVTLQVTGNNGPHKIAWSYVRLVGGPPAVPSWAEGSGDTFGVAATASNTTMQFKVSAVITGTDGRTLNYSDILTLQFGTV